MDPCPVVVGEPGRVENSGNFPALVSCERSSGDPPLYSGIAEKGEGTVAAVPSNDAEVTDEHRPH
jgi:hypothetical protein